MVKTGQDCRYAVGHIRGYYVEDGPDPARGRIGHRTGVCRILHPNFREFTIGEVQE